MCFLLHFLTSQSHVTWNASSIPYMYTPTSHTYTCGESTLYPTPGLVEGLQVTSCSTNGSHTTLHLEWSPPSFIAVELNSYDVCTDVILEWPDQEMPDNHSGSHQCSQLKFNVGEYSFFMCGKLSILSFNILVYCILHRAD